MKKLLIIAVIIGCSVLHIGAEMRFNPFNNLIYSHPETSDINQDEYRILLVACIEIEARLITMNGGKRVSKKVALDQFNVYLKAVGTSTALRLIADLKSNKIYYSNGRFMKKILV